MRSQVVRLIASRPMIEIDIPKTSAFCGLISPIDSGLFEVLVIIGSISLSYHILIQLAPPAVK